MSLEFRYGAEKVLGAQPRLTRRLDSTHYVPNLNLIKGSFNMLVKLTHTLTCITTPMHQCMFKFISILMAFNQQKPNQDLSNKLKRDMSKQMNRGSKI